MAIFAVNLSKIINLVYRMKLSKLLTAITVLAACAAPAALRAEGIGVAIVKADGSVHQVELQHVERIDIGPEAVTLHRASGQSVAHDIAQVERIDIGVDVTDGISQIAAAGDIAVWPTLVETSLNVAGAPAQAPISVYSVAGSAVAIANANSGGTATLDLSQLPAGAYVVAIAERHSVKIVKK